METAKEVTNERSGKEDDKSLVACIVTDVSVTVQQRRCTEEDRRRESADSRYRAVAAVRQRQQRR